MGPWEGGLSSLEVRIIAWRGEGWRSSKLCRFVLEEGLEVAEDAGGDGDGTFYLPGGETVDPALLKETLDFLESVRGIS